MKLQQLVRSRLAALRLAGVTARQQVKVARKRGFKISEPVVSQYRNVDFREMLDLSTIKTFAFILKVDVAVVAVAALNTIGVHIEIPPVLTTTESGSCEQCGTRHGESEGMLLLPIPPGLTVRQRRRYSIHVVREAFAEFHRIRAEQREHEQQL
jgi:hypothetical protein